MNFEGTSKFRVHVPFLFFKNIVDFLGNRISLTRNKDAKFLPVQNHGVAPYPMETVYI